MGKSGGLLDFIRKQKIQAARAKLKAASSGSRQLEKLEVAALPLLKQLQAKVAENEAARRKASHDLKQARRKCSQIANALLQAQRLPPARAISVSGSLGAGFNSARTLRHHGQKWKEN